MKPVGEHANHIVVSGNARLQRPSRHSVTAIIEDREPLIDVYEALAMTAPGIVAHESSRKDGEWLRVPKFERPAT